MSVLVWRRIKIAVLGKVLSATALFACSIFINYAKGGTLTGSIDLGVQNSKAESDTKTRRTKTTTQRYNMDYDGVLYQPWLATYQMGGTFASTETEGDMQNTETELSSYRLKGKLFPWSPFPLSMYMMSNEIDVTSESSEGTKIDSEMYGADLRLDFYTLPTTNIYHYGQTTVNAMPSLSSEQESETTGIRMQKKWAKLSSSLRLEQSQYDENINQASAAAERFNTAWTYRPSNELQTSLVLTSYDRTGQSKKTSTDVDPLYSNRMDDSANVTMLWNPNRDTNINLGANYFKEEYEANKRKAHDSRAAVNYNVTQHLHTFVSSYRIKTILNDEIYRSQDGRVGLGYRRGTKYKMLELQGNLNGGYYKRQIEASDGISKTFKGNFYQVGGRADLPFYVAKVRMNPYYDVSYSENQQSTIHDATVLQQETGLRMDGRAFSGHLGGNLSVRETEQQSEQILYTKQTKGSVDYRRHLSNRSQVKVQTGFSHTEGRVEDDLFESFTQDQNTDTETKFARLDYSTHIGGGARLKGSYRVDRRVNKVGESEKNKAFDVRVSYQIGKLHSEIGFIRKQSEMQNINSEDSLWFIRIRRDFSTRL